MIHYPVVEVRWNDASIETSDFTLKDAQKTKPVKRWTTGYLVAETEETLVLATDFYESDKRNQEFAARLQIPWSMIIEYWIHPL